MKRFLLILLRIAIAVMALVLIVAALSQTQFFRDRIRSYAIEGLQSALDAEIVVGELRGNLIAGFSLDSLSINVDGIPVVSTSRVEIHYNLLRLPGRRISLGSVILTRPTVRLLANRSGSWNVQRMLRPRATESPDSAGSAGRTPWAIEVQNLEIRDGRVILFDSAWVNEHPEEPGTVDYQNFLLQGVNSAMSGSITEGEKEIAIKRFSCTLERPSIHIRDLLLTARVTPTETNVELLHLLTDRSSVTFTGNLQGVDLLGEGFSLASLRKKPVRATLALDPLDLAELRQFLPPVNFLDGTVGGVLSVKGDFGRLEIDRFDLLHGKTALHLRGTMANLHHPPDLVLDVQMEQTNIDGSDVRALLPGLDLPDMSALGVANLSLRFSGRPVDFTAGGIVATDAGVVEIPGVALRVGGPGNLTYKGDVVFRDLNLAAVLGDPEMRSDLSGSAHADGRGTSFATLLSSFEVRLDSSSFLGEPITNTWCSVGVRDKRLLGRVQGELGGTRAELTARLDENQDGVSAFMLNGEMAGLNLARVLRDDRYDSDIGVKIDASGSGLTWDELDGTLLLDFSHSRYRDYTLDSAYLQFTATPLDSNRKLLTVGSQMLDVVVEGVFTPASFLRYARYYAMAIRRDVSERLAPVDTTFRNLVDPRELEKISAEIEAGGPSPDATFTFQLKSLDPLATILGRPKITGTGIVTGELTGKPEELKLSSRLLLDEFAYGNDAEGGLFIDRADLSIVTKGITPTHPLEKADLTLLGTIDRLAINKSLFESLGVDFRYGSGQSVFTVGFSGAKGNMRVDVGGTSRLVRDTIAVKVDRLDASYEKYAWHGEPGIQIDISGGGLHVRNGALIRAGERVAFEGILQDGSSIQGTLRASAFDLDAVKYILEEQSPGVRRAFFNGTADVVLSLSGTLSAPRYQAVVRAHDVFVRDMLLGEVGGNLAYENHTLNGRVTATDKAGSPPQLVVEGGIPMNLDLAGETLPGIADQPANLSITAARFQLAALDPFLPAFDEFMGLLDADLKLTGPIRNPRYAGNFSVANGSFLFEPNNIRYTFDGTFRASGERIEVLGVNVRNLEEDALADKVGAVTITGDLSLKSFRPGDFNLTVRGDLLVVKESTRSSSLEVSGALFGEIDPAGLRFTGGIEHSLLKGSVAIRNSNLVLPPTQTQAAEQSATSVPVIYVDDTTRVVTQRRKAAEQYFTDRGKEVSGEDETPTVSFMDGLSYDLQVEAPGGSTTIEMIFNSLTAEKLVATINGRWAIRGSKSHWLGELTISQAYYNFLKRFDAEGKIRYTGDILNPTLDIVATYQGQRPTQDTTGRLFEKIVVRFKITGTKQEPKIEPQMTIDDVDYANYHAKGRTSNDVQSDAIQFIVYGNFPLNQTEKTEANSNLEKQLGFSAITGATTMLTGALSEFLRTQTGFISSVDFSYGTAGRPAVIRLSGSALNGYWRFGGRIVDEPLTNADFSLMYSFESIFGAPQLRNLMFEFERKVETSSLQLNDLKRVNSARLFYRFSF